MEFKERLPKIEDFDSQKIRYFLNFVYFIIIYLS